MNTDEFQEFFEGIFNSNLLSEGISFDQLTDVMVDAGLDVSELTDDQISQLMSLTGNGSTEKLSVDEAPKGDGTHFGGNTWERWPSGTDYERRSDGTYTGDYR